ncbi:MAG: four helix bundle protein [Gemmatimonadetes bacterium]|nr:MAG: four helix bundle protein [Gemmatimonadota bacterium]
MAAKGGEGRQKHEPREEMVLLCTSNCLSRHMATHKRFLAWQECHKLVLAVYKATECFPKHELYGLTSQLRRAALSAAVNIVEGASKKGRNEFRRFLDMSLGSLSEVEYELEVAGALGYLKDDVCSSLTNQGRRAHFLTWKLKISMNDAT